MFLRWMVRYDHLDMGLWKNVDKKDLILPLDTHTFKVGFKLGLLKRKTYDLQSAIEITQTLRTFDLNDPMKYDLLFERFLNPERVSMPDIDMDFMQARRGEIIDYVVEKYGRNQVAQIITFGSLLAKGVLRDVARVLDMPYSKADAMAKLIPDELGITLNGKMKKDIFIQVLKY